MAESQNLGKFGAGQSEMDWPIGLERNGKTPFFSFPVRQRKQIFLPPYLRITLRDRGEGGLGAGAFAHDRGALQQSRRAVVFPALSVCPFSCVPTRLVCRYGGLRGKTSYFP